MKYRTIEIYQKNILYSLLNFCTSIPTSACKITDKEAEGGGGLDDDTAGCHEGRELRIVVHQAGAHVSRVWG